MKITNIHTGKHKTKKVKKMETPKQTQEGRFLSYGTTLAQTIKTTSFKRNLWMKYMLIIKT